MFHTTLEGPWGPPVERYLSEGNLLNVALLASIWPRLTKVELPRHTHSRDTTPATIDISG